MERPFIVLGDKPDHGGEVIEASAVTGTHGSATLISSQWAGGDAC